MGFKVNFGVVAGTLNGITAGNFYNGPAMATARIKPGCLAAHIVADLETTSITGKVAWQGADKPDFSDPVDLAINETNAADASSVTLGTGTGGADATITKAVPAPDTAYAFRYVRARILVQGATGTTNDTIAIGYTFRGH